MLSRLYFQIGIIIVMAKDKITNNIKILRENRNINFDEFAKSAGILNEHLFLKSSYYYNKFFKQLQSFLITFFNES